MVFLTEWTRRSENDDTPQPLDLWTNSPFIGQQVGNWSICHALCNHKEAHCASNIVSNSHLFHSKPIELPIPKIWLLKIWPWKYKVKVRGEVKVLSHNLGLTSYQIMLEIPTGPPVRGQQLHPMDSYPCMSIHPLIPMIELFFKIWPSKSKVKVIAQGHIIGITSYWLTSLWFHVNQPSHFRDTAFLKFDLQNPRSKS